MPIVLRKTSLLFAVCLALAASATINTATAQNKPAPKAHQSAPSQAETTQADAADQNTPDTADDELEAAAVTLDVSHSSPLIQKLYQATRETKEQDILARLNEAKKLLADGADVKATDQYDRTALHWTVFGSSYNTKPSHHRLYEEMADQLIQKGVEINHDPHVDREREWIETDLLYAGTATAYARVDRPHIPKTTANATGDVITTDSQLSVLELGTTKPNIINPPNPTLQTRPTTSSQ